MKTWFWPMVAAGALLAVLSIALELSGVSLLVDTHRVRNIDLVIVMRVVGIGGLVALVAAWAFSRPLVASLRRARERYPDDLAIVCQRVTKESPFRRVGPIAHFPLYFVVVISAGGVRFFDRGSRLFHQIDAEQIAQAGVGSTILGRRTWNTVRLESLNGAFLDVLPSREGDELAADNDETSVLELVERIRRRLGTLPL